MTLNQKRLAVLFTLLIATGLIVSSFVDNGLARQLFAPDRTNEQRVEVLRSFFLSWGSSGPVVYVAVVVIEVVIAPIPGTLLYLPGGAIFGGFVGGLCALTGNVIGAGISCSLSRFLIPSSEKQQSEKMRRTVRMIEQRGFWIILLLRLNPLTSSDLVSYAAGLTRIRSSTVMLATSLGMAPLCFTQSYLSQSLFEVFPGLIWGIVVLCALYAVALGGWLIRAGQKSRVNSGPSDDKPN